MIWTRHVVYIWSGIWACTPRPHSFSRKLQHAFFFFGVKHNWIWMFRLVFMVFSLILFFFFFFRYHYFCVTVFCVVTIWTSTTGWDLISEIIIRKTIIAIGNTHCWFYYYNDSHIRIPIFLNALTFVFATINGCDIHLS